MLLSAVSRRKLRTREESKEKFLHHLFAHTRPSSSPRTITVTIGEPPPVLFYTCVIPAPIILTQPLIDRIQARRIAKYRRNVAEVVVDCVAYVPTLTSYILAHAMLMYVRHMCL